MTVKAKLNAGVEFRVEVSLEEMTAAFERALAEGRMLEIKSADGTVRRVNPGQVLYFEDATGVEANADSATARQAAVAG